MQKIVYGNAKDGEFFAHLSAGTAKEYRRAKKALVDAKRYGNAFDSILANIEYSYAFRKCELENELNYQKNNIEYWNAEPVSELVLLRISEIKAKMNAIENTIIILEKESRKKF